MTTLPESRRPFHVEDLLSEPQLEKRAFSRKIAVVDVADVVLT